MPGDGTVVREPAEACSEFTKHINEILVGQASRDLNARLSVNCVRAMMVQELCILVPRALF